MMVNMMSRGGSTRVANTALLAASHRLFSTVKGLGGEVGGGSYYLVRGTAVYGSGVRNKSTLAFSDKDNNEEKKRVDLSNSDHSSAAPGENKEQKGIVSYWGIHPSRITKPDGTEWGWNCFKPWETYKSDLSIDLKKHHAPTTFLDKMAYWTVRTLRFPTDLFFQKRYGCRAMMLETVAAVPGMVGGMMLHFKSLRRFEHSGGWIKALLEEAENERMHLMTFMEVSKPTWYDRALVLIVQGIFFNAYFLGYMLSPKFAHRVVGYLEEEAIYSYTEFLKELDKGNIENVPAPAIAKDYWQLPPDSTLRDVVMVVRADEAHHRDVNHFASDIHYQGRELREAAAPIGYH
ncbi:ubiquinol oxidase 1, mitochondrial-like [Gastrolobium bilobum]|uniref:ubiquinol oxidase 1, mitochondrial-like n=1 Tax=Gastrolobium bilobum TaxID=150636 RepID=UPI002AB059EE|nr:ubiquinol oxidase 1, mitochondrial-like [Gastrolobium bilobum]